MSEVLEHINGYEVAKCTQLYMNSFFRNFFYANIQLFAKRLTNAG